MQKGHGVWDKEGYRKNKIQMKARYFSVVAATNIIAQGKKKKVK